MRQLLQREFDDAPFAEYEIDPKDFYASVKYMSKKFSGSKVRTVWWKKFPLYVLIGALSAIAYSQLESAGVVAESDLISFFVGAVAAIVFIGVVSLVLCFWIIPARSSLRLEKAIPRERHAVWRGDNGLAFETASKTVFFDYKGIDEVAALGHGMIIRSGVLGFYVPNSAFGSDIRHREFLTLLKSKLDGKTLSASSIFAPMGV